MTDDVFCRGEARLCPRDEFEHVRGWGLCHTKNVDRRHTVGGTTIDDEQEVPLEGIDVMPDAGGEW